ncbi:hypothetical protein BDY19DRAFT_346756 [Irpex rosettiformis]|uniref:Uncharacterized protein n=1 Tax=Irpex rosettiformis TaxID=378272 RepID=A0ACB8TWT2_9APHY|nr:hypothetical protein BDY19DRAFT_346756 [Irpex rosettiformis]
MAFPQLSLPLLLWFHALLLSTLVKGAKLSENGASRPCIPGSFSVTGRTPCQPCPEGSFTSHWSSTSCELAEPGYYVPLPGSSAAFACDAGTHSYKGSIACTLALNEVLAQSDKAKGRGRTRPASVKRPCRYGLMHCPVYGKWYGGVFVKNYECVDVRHDLESCGGCVHSDSLGGGPNSLDGQDCSQIAGVDTVRCVQGRCVIDKCAWGYAVSADKSHCHPAYGKYY